MRPSSRLLVSSLVLVAGASYAAWQMQLASWDFRNYHLYVPWAWLHGRLATDVAAAQLQTYFNPLLLLWLPWAAVHLPAVGVVAALGALQATNALLLHAIARRTIVGPRWLAVLAAAAGTTAATQLAEMGTTNGDNLVSIPLLGAIAILVRDDRAGVRRAIAAGALIGVAAGLKLSNAPCALGTFVAAMLLPAPNRLRHAAWLASGATLGFALVVAPWAWQQYVQWGDPLFPMLPHLFPSPVALGSAPHDLRFLPADAREWLLQPLAAAYDWHRVSDYRFHDLRLPVLWLGSFALLVLAAVRRDLVAGLMRDAWPWLAGLLVALATWLFVFGYQRYVLPVEMLAPLALVLACRRLFGPRADRWTACVLVLLMPLTNPPNIGVIASRAPPLYDVSLPRDVPLAGATVLVAGVEPLAFVALALPRDARFVRIEGNFFGGHPGSRRFDTYVAREAAKPAPRYAALFQARSPAALPQRFSDTGFTIDSTRCGRVESRLVPPHEAPVWLCVARPRD